MSEIKFTELKCQRCGGELKENGDTYVCTGCGKSWQVSGLNGFADMLKSCEEALRGQRVADIANLRQLLWAETHKEFVSNFEVERLCREILKYLPRDFYANFYLATCSSGKTELGDFLYNVDVKEHYDDIAQISDYVLKALKTEWTMDVSNFIEKIKDVDIALYNKYRTIFESEYAKIDDGIFEPAFPRDVFIAYSSKDMAEVTKLVAALEEESLTCFVAARNMRHGSGSADSYFDIIHTAINNCQVVVFVSSDNSRSTTCDAHKELNYIKETRGAMPRVELVIKNYSGKAAERFFTNFFEGHEYCTSVKDTVERVSEILLNGAKVAEQEVLEQQKKLEQERKQAEEQARLAEEQACKAEEERLRREQEAQAEQARLQAEEQAKKEILSLGDFKDLVNGYVTFGSYPQSKKSVFVKISGLCDQARGYYRGSDNCLYEEYQGKYYKVEPIKWKVLSRGEEWFLVADKILDVHIFDEESNNYKNSEIRSWLNGEFYNKAFNEGQRNKIITAMVDNSLSSTGDRSNSYVCGDTKDKIFLLSNKEVKQYFISSSVRKKKGTDFAKASGLFVNSGNSRWWLRSPLHNFSNLAQYVYYGGDFGDFNVDISCYGVVCALKFKP